MNRYSRTSKRNNKATQNSDSSFTNSSNDQSDDDDESTTPTAPPFPASEAVRTLAKSKLGRAYTTEDEKRAVYLHLIALKKEGYTHERCADELGVSLRTIANYVADSYYTELVQEMTVGSKQRGYALIDDTTGPAVKKLWELMYTAKSEFVQYKSAEYLLKIGGYEVPQEVRERDNQSELMDFLLKLEKRSKKGRQVNVTITDMPSEAPERHESIVGGMVVESDRSSPTAVAVDAKEHHSELPEEYLLPMLPGGRLPSLDKEEEPEEREA